MGACFSKKSAFLWMTFFIICKNHTINCLIYEIKTPTIPHSTVTYSKNKEKLKFSLWAVDNNLKLKYRQRQDTLKQKGASFILKNLRARKYYMYG